MDQEKDREKTKLEQEKISIEKEVAFGIWIQAIGQLIELAGLEKLSQLEGNTNSLGEREILSGAFLQTLGLIFEGIGVSNQIAVNDDQLILGAQKLAITGDWLQSIGAALEAIGGTELLYEEPALGKLFVP